MMTRSLLVAPLLLVICLFRSAGAEDGWHSFSCEPALPIFCRNIHVGCAGATKIRTSAFEVVIAGADARVTFAGADTVLHGRVSNVRDLVIRLHNSRDWIRIQHDKRFSHRIYRKRGAAMSFGTCVRQTG